MNCRGTTDVGLQSADTRRSWSRDGRYLLSSSQDWKCILWDMKDGSRVRTVRFEAPVYIAELHPFNQYVDSFMDTSFWPRLTTATAAGSL